MKEVKEILKKLNEPEFRYKQFLDAYYKNYIDSIDNISVWPLKLKEEVKKSIDINTLEPVRELSSKDKDTIKILFKRKSDDKVFETVLMRHRDGRNTVCISCMIGCPVGCTFCATGKMGFIANLNANEMVEQVIYCARLVKLDDEKISNVVFMGMGEPMLNLDEVSEAIRILTDEKMFALGDKRITVSTSGYVNKLREFISRGLKVRLAVSLHASDQELREQLMPVAKSNTLRDLFRVLDEYTKITNKRITYEYILIKGVNDSLKQAEELSRLLRGRLAHVNLIPYNPVEGIRYEKATRFDIIKFQEVLDRTGIHNSIRVTMGSDVRAACGQLASKN